MANSGVAADSGWEQLFKTAFERSSDPIELLSVERRRLAVNDALCGLLGRPRDGLLGTPLEAIVAPEDAAQVPAGWARFLDSGRWLGDMALVRGDGGAVKCSFAAVATEVDRQRQALFVWLVSGWEVETEAGPRDRHPLTKREREVVNLTARGRSGPQIAVELVVAPGTVKTHIANAMGKLGASTRAHLVAIVLTDGEILR